MNGIIQWTVLGLLFFALPQGGIPTNSQTEQPEPTEIPVYTYRVVKEYPHDRDAYTQGLLYENGMLYEGTGQNGSSSVRLVELETGKVLRQHNLQSRFFGEGLTLFEGKLIQLTWTGNTGFVYEPSTFEEIRRFSYPWEGWGITHDGTNLIMSDGTDTLHVLNPDTFEQVREIKVKMKDMPIRMLNELEYIKGEIYSNVWMEDFIVRIDPHSGNVNSVIDLRGLLKPAVGFPRPDVLNGIAYDAEGDRLFVTGKRWQSLFHIEIMLQGGNANIKDWKEK